MKPTLDPLSILIVKTSARGDVLTTLSILPHLKKLAPNMAVDWVVENGQREFIDAHPLIRKTIAINSKSWKKSPFSRRTRIESVEAFRKLRQSRYDILFDFQGNTKSGIVTLLAKAHHKVGLGKGVASEWPNLLTTNKKFTPSLQNQQQDYLEVIYDFFGEKLPENIASEPIDFNTASIDSDKMRALFPKKQKVALICPQSAWDNKRLKRRTMTSFLQRAQAATGCKLLFAWGSDIERCNAEKMHLDLGDSSEVLPKLTPLELYEAVKQADLVISVDSFSLHLAATTTTPTFSIFGPSLGSYYAPIGKQHAFFQGQCPYNLSFEKRCPLLRTCKTGACIKRIDSEHLFKVFSTSIGFQALQKKESKAKNLAQV